MMAPITRRLLSIDEAAEKLGYEKSWLTKHRQRLEQSGFPKPVLGGGHGSPMRWDNLAIDLWLDSHMPDHLRQFNMSRRDVTAMAAVDTFSLEKHLSERARGLSL